MSTRVCLDPFTRHGRSSLGVRVPPSFPERALLRTHWGLHRPTILLIPDFSTTVPRHSTHPALNRSSVLWAPGPESRTPGPSVVAHKRLGARPRSETLSHLLLFLPVGSVKKKINRICVPTKKTTNKKPKKINNGCKLLHV